MTNKLTAEEVAQVVNGLVGIEVEMHRATTTGQLSQFPYPTGLADQREHHFIKNDFLQTQSELITPATASTTKTLQYLGVYHQALRSALHTGELLWPYSMPPKLRGDHSDIEIAQTDLESYRYRQKVAELRKVERTAETGVHINLGLTYRGLQALDATPPSASNRYYLTAAAGFYRYRWLLTYLFGATPLTMSHYFAAGEEMPQQPVRSLRNSHYGFGNGIPGHYASAQAYVDQIEQAVANGDLIAEREFYGIVRLKGGTDLQDLVTQGISYIELRTLDLDPFEPLGISEDAINWIRLMFTYFVLNGSAPDAAVDDEIEAAEQKNEAVALESPFRPTRYMNEGLAVIDAVQTACGHLSLPFNVQMVCQRMRERLLNPALTPSARLVTMATGTGLQETLAALAHEYNEDLRHRPLIGQESLPKKVQDELLMNLRAGINLDDSDL